MKPVFPTLIHPDYATQDGCFFASSPDGLYRKIELYLPAEPSTYGRRTMAEVAGDMFEKLRRGHVKPKRAIGTSGHPLGSKYHIDNGRLRTDPFEVPTK